MTQEALKQSLECAERCEAIDGMYSWSATITAIKEALAEYAMQQRLGRELLQEPLELCQYGQEPASCTSNPMDCQCAIDAALAQTQEPVPPPWWTAVENILNEYGLQAIDFVADFKQALAQTQEPDYWLGYGLQAHTEKPFESATPLYTHPPKRTEQEPVESLCCPVGKCAYRSVHKEENCPRENVLKESPQRTWVGLDHQDKKKFSSWLDHKTDDEVFTAIDDLLREMNT